MCLNKQKYCNIVALAIIIKCNVTTLKPGSSIIIQYTIDVFAYTHIPSLHINTNKSFLLCLIMLIRDEPKMQS